MSNKLACNRCKKIVDTPLDLYDRPGVCWNCFHHTQYPSIKESGHFITRCIECGKTFRVNYADDMSFMFASGINTCPDCYDKELPDIVSNKISKDILFAKEIFL